MKFTPKIWACDDGKQHCVIEVNFDKSDIVAATDVADAKVKFINVHNPGGIKRDSSVIRGRIIAGKLADAAVAALLERQIKKSGLCETYDIREYDKVRADGFENPDPFDLELTKHNKQFQTIEVRSSFSYRLAPAEKIIKKLSIYGWYTSANKAAESQRDWYWQVVYYLRPSDIPQSGNLDVPVFETELEKGALVGYVVGGASCSLLNAHGISREDQDGANYRAISPICNGFDYWGMVTAMFGITKTVSL